MKLATGIAVSVICLAVWLWPPPSSPPVASTPDQVSGANRVTTSPATGKIALHLLYAGSPGSAREREFVQFMGQHFQAVKTGDWSQFDGSQATGFDVVILDYAGDGFQAPPLRMAPNYNHPTMTIGVAGARLCSRLNLKPAYM